MNARAASTYPALTLRCTVVLPGAFVEGALAVLLPWLIVQATLDTPWLGVASALVVLAALLGALGAPTLARSLGPRRMVITTGFAVVLSLGAACVFWMMGVPAIAYGFALVALAADSACDVGFSARLPLLARLSRQPLVKFSAANWLWGISGAALGSVLAGWAISTQAFGALVFGLVLLSFAVAISLSLLSPRDARLDKRSPAIFGGVFSAGFWTTRAVIVTLALVGFVFFVGPLDNLLVPAHLAARELPASTFGNLVAAAGLGLAIGLVATQSTRFQATHRGLTILLALIGIAAQLGLLLWLPSNWLLIAGVLVSSALFAPLLPMLEAALLTATSASHRMLLLAMVSTFVSMADMMGTLTFGVIVGLSNSTVALSICCAVACGAVLVFGVGHLQRMLTRR